MTSDAMAANRRKWDEMAAANLASDLYRVEAFKRGERRGLHPLEWEEVGEVAGKSVLHLQCHFGLDSLALQRAGAEVTGLDFSHRAIAAARELAAELELDTRFVEGNVYDAPTLIDSSFDLVFVTWGTICWLPDIEAWARIVADFLTPGGRFYFSDQHPAALTLDDEETQPPLRVRYPYFHKPEPLVFDDDGYADASVKLENRRGYEWIHPVGEVVTALIDAGLRLEFLHEHPFCAWQAFPMMRRDADGLWWLPEEMPTIPLSYSLKARKPIGEDPS